MGKKLFILASLALLLPAGSVWGQSGTGYQVLRASCNVNGDTAAFNPADGDLDLVRVTVATGATRAVLRDSDTANTSSALAMPALVPPASGNTAIFEFKPPRRFVNGLSVNAVGSDPQGSGVCVEWVEKP